MVPPRPDAFGVWMSTPAISSTASTASAMTRAFWNLAIDPGDFTQADRDEPGPSASELPHGRLLQLLLELVVAAECVLQSVGDAAVRVTATTRAHDRPEDRVVGVTAGVVADRGADVLGHGADPPEK